MPTVFLSYVRADLPLIEQLDAQLTGHPDICIWRDQDKIYGEQKWPKVLGEASCLSLALVFSISKTVFIQAGGLFHSSISFGYKDH